MKSSTLYIFLGFILLKFFTVKNSNAQPDYFMDFGSAPYQSIENHPDVVNFPWPNFGLIQQLPIGFDFELYGSNYTTVDLSTGTLGITFFEIGAATGSTISFMTDVILGFQQTIHATYDTSYLYLHYDTLGLNKKLIIEINNFTHRGDFDEFGNLQIILNQNDGSVTFHYGKSYFDDFDEMGFRGTEDAPPAFFVALGMASSTQKGFVFGVVDSNGVYSYEISDTVDMETIPRLLNYPVENTYFKIYPDFGQSKMELNRKISSIIAYPNPASNLINIEGIEYLEGSEYTLIDLMGKVLQIGHLSSNHAITLDELNSGLYFIQVKRTNGEVSTLKFLKQ